MTTKRLNFKLLAILGVGGAIFLGGVYFLHEFQVSRNAAGLLRRADAARAEGDLDESARLRIRYLSHVPDNAAQYKETALDLKSSLFSKLLKRKEIKKKEVDLVVRFIGNAVTYNSKDKEVRREASDFWYQMRKYDYAVENLEELEAENWTDEDRMRYINSLRLMGGPMEAKAMKEFESTIGWNADTSEFDGSGTHPNLLDAYQALVMLLMHKDLDRDAALKVMSQMVEVNKDDPKAYLNRSRLVRFVRGKAGVEQGYADIDAAYKLAPDDLDVIAAKSGMMLETDRGEEAKRLIELGLTKTQEISDEIERRQAKSRLFRLLSEVHITLEDTEGALAVLERANREVPRDRDLLWNKARLLLDAKRHADVEAMYKPLKKAGHDDPMIGYLQARILMNNGDYVKASRGLRKIRDVLPANMQYDADIYLGEAYGRLGKYDLQLATVRSLREKYPDNQQVNESYLQILLQLRRTKEAQEFLSARISEIKLAGKEIPKNYQLAQMTLQMNDASTGTQQLSDAQQADLDRKIDEALKDESITEAQRQSLLLRKLRQTNDPKAAKQILQAAINRAYKESESPDSFLLWAMLIDFAENETEALQFFNVMKNKIDPEKYAASMASMRAKIAVKHAPDTSGPVMTEIENNLSRYTDNEQLSLLYEMGKLNLALTHRDEAIRLFEKSLQAPGASPQVKTEILNVLFDDAMIQADADRINEIAERIRATVGQEDESYRIVEARRIVWNIRTKQTSEDQKADELRRARQLIESIRRARSEWLPGILVESDIHRLDNNPVAAIELLEMAHSLQNSNAKIIRAIAQSYRELKQPAKADLWMKKLPSNFRNDTDNRFDLTALWARRSTWTAEDAQKAVQLLEAVAPADTTDLKNQLLRSQLYLHLKQLDTAEAAARKAAEIDPASEDVWMVLVNIYTIQGKKDKALEAVQEAARALPDDTKPIVVGRCYAIMREFEQAERSFLTALTADKTQLNVKRMLAETFVADKKIKPALQVIQDIIATGDKSKPEDILVVFWARRALAKILASTKNHQNFQKALELLEDNAIDGELAREDLSLLVSFCYARPERSSWDRALLRIDQISQKRKLTDDEIFMQAQIYEKYGDQYWNEIKKMTTGVLARNGSNKAAVENYVRWLLKRGEVEEAETWSDNNLEEGAVTRFRVDLHSDVKRGNFQRAVQRIKQRLPKQQSLNLPEAQSQQLTLAAIAEELGQYDPRFYNMSAQLLRQLAAVAPSEILRVASVIGTHGDTAQVKEALKMCFDAHKSEVPNAVSAGVAITVLRKHSKDWEGSLASSVQNVSSWLDQISAANSDDVLLQWRVAEFYDMIGNLDRVEEKYKEILAAPEFKNPTDRGMVLNNLAFAMALNGKTDEPLQLISQAEELLGDSADLIDTKGYIFLVKGETDRAISEFQAAIKNGRKSGQKYFHLALAYHQKREQSKAEENWKLAIENGLDRHALPPALRMQFDKLQADFGGVASNNVLHSIR